METMTKANCVKAKCPMHCLWKSESKAYQSATAASLTMPQVSGSYARERQTQWHYYGYRHINQQVINDSGGVNRYNGHERAL
jgi:hypothetical protein